MIQAAVILRKINPDDIHEAMKLSLAEGWNQTENDWRILIENPKNVCLLAEYNNRMAGTTTAMNYSNDIMWIGMVLVDKEYRGTGISKFLLTAIFKKIEFSKSVKLDATPAGQLVYKKFGFKDEYLIARMVNLSLKEIAADESELKPEPIQLKDIPEIVDFDRSTFGADRHQLIEILIREYPGQGWFLKENNQVTGFVLGRAGNKYHQIGPVAALTGCIAKILISKVLESVAYQPVVVDVLSDKAEMIDWLTSKGFSKQRDFMRMYKDANPFPGIANNYYLIAGPEFG